MNEHAAEAPKKGKGCVFWGCLTVLLLALVMGGCISVGIYVAYRNVQDYTATEPIAIPAFEPPPGAWEDVEARGAAFEEGAAAELRLSGDDLNTLIPKGLPWLAGKVFARVEGDTVFLDLSVPLAEIPVVGTLAGERYFNGRVGVQPRLVDGQFVLVPQSAEVEGKPVPQKAIDEIGAAFVERAEKGRGGPDYGVLGEFARMASSIEVRDGEVILERGAPEE